MERSKHAGEAPAENETMDGPASTPTTLGETVSTKGPMRILVHDYAGHAYAIQLSRALAQRGHNVRHVYCASNPMPQGALQPLDSDAPTLEIEPIHLKQRIQKGQFLKRRQSEIEHGRLLESAVRAFCPDIVISGSAALDTQNHLWKACRTLDVPAVFWLQDLTGMATHTVLSRRIPVLGGAIGSYYVRMEVQLLRDSAGIVAITQDFCSVLDAMGVRQDRVSVIENWGPIAEIPVMPKENAWSERHGLAHTVNFVYSGTLGMKHNPQLLVDLAEAFKADKEVRVVVVTEGIGRGWLDREKAARGLDNLVLMDFQAYADVPSVLGSADALVVLLEPEAGVYSVPSKTLAGLCAGRPLLMAIPRQNLAARIVDESESGLLADPHDAVQLVAHATRLRNDGALRDRLGANARAYAESKFDVEGVAEKFERLFRQCLERLEAADALRG